MVEGEQMKELMAARLAVYTKKDYMIDRVLMIFIAALLMIYPFAAWVL